MYIDITEHCIDQVIKRTSREEVFEAKQFATNLFKRLYECNKTKTLYKWSEVKIFKAEEWKFKIVAWNHKFVYKKSIWEVLLITYIKKTPLNRYVQKFVSNKYK